MLLDSVVSKLRLLSHITGLSTSILYSDFESVTVQNSFMTTKITFLTGNFFLPNLKLLPADLKLCMVPFPSRAFIFASGSVNAPFGFYLNLKVPKNSGL